MVGGHVECGMRGMGLAGRYDERIPRVGIKTEIGWGVVSMKWK